MQKNLIKPITSIEEAELNPGGDELHTHTENEDIIIHDVDDIIYEEYMNSAQIKLSNLIRGYYDAVDSEIPLEEFYYNVTETVLIIYDRYGIYLLDDNVNNFTIDEIDWILSNLPIFNDGLDNKNMSNVYIEFHEFRKDGWMVFRRSGSYNQLIGWIRKDLINSKPDRAIWYFDDRDDYCIVTEEERRLIAKFLGDNTVKIPVSRIVLSPESIKLQIGKTQALTIRIYPVNADNKEYTVNYDKTIIQFNDKTKTIKAINEGITTITITSKDDPTKIATANVEVYEYEELLNDNYKIVRRDSDDFNRYKTRNSYEYIIGMKDNYKVSSFIQSFKNRRRNVQVFTKDGVYVDDAQILATGMIVRLNVNGRVADELHVVVKGDVSGDGYINSTDTYMIQQLVNETADLVDEFYIAGDVNESGTVNLIDTNQINKYINGEITEFEKQNDSDVERYLEPYNYRGFLTVENLPSNEDYQARVSSNFVLIYTDILTNERTSVQTSNLTTLFTDFSVQNDYLGYPLMKFKQQPPTDSCLFHDKDHIYKEFRHDISEPWVIDYLGIPYDTTIRACARCGFIDKIYSPSTKITYWSDNMEPKELKDYIRPGIYTFKGNLNESDGNVNVFSRMELTPAVKHLFKDSMNPQTNGQNYLNKKSYVQFRYNYDQDRINTNTYYYPSSVNRVILTQPGFDIENVYKTEANRIRYDKTICNGNHEHIDLYLDTISNSPTKINNVLGSDRIRLDYCWKCGHINKMYEPDTKQIFWESNGNDEWFAVSADCSEGEHIAIPNYKIDVVNADNSNGFAEFKNVTIHITYQDHSKGTIELGLQTDNINGFLIENGSYTINPNIINPSYSLVKTYYGTDNNPDKRTCTEHAHFKITSNLYDMNDTLYNKETKVYEHFIVDFCPYCDHIHSIKSHETNYLFYNSEISE